MYTDDAITFAFGTTDGQILAWENTPLTSVVAPLEISPLMIMWDPETYPDVTSIADLGEQGITVNAFGGQTFTTVLSAMGVLSEDQVDPSYDGGPSRFIAEGGAIAQQGFASGEPFLYETVYEDWLRPVDYELIHDAGFQTYSQTLAIRPDDLESLRPCLEAFVPVVQHSAVEFITDPARTNAAIVDIVEQYDTFWVYTAELAEYSVTTQAELGLTGNGPDDVIGNFDPDRVETLLQQVRDAGLEVPDDLTADQLYTNEFIDDDDRPLTPVDEADDDRRHPGPLGAPRRRPDPLPRMDRRGDGRGPGRCRQGDPRRRPRADPPRPCPAVGRALPHRRGRRQLAGLHPARVGPRAHRRRDRASPLAGTRGGGRRPCRGRPPRVHRVRPLTHRPPPGVNDGESLNIERQTRDNWW